jgi:hypothetical protein
MDNITIHKDSQDQATFVFAQLGVNVPFTKASHPAHL